MTREVERAQFVAREGKLKQMELSARERDPQVRAMALACRGVVCEICGLNFAERYGDFASGCVEVHHLNQLSLAGVQGTNTTIEDLLVVCPNCHRALHRFRDPSDWRTFQK